MDTNEIKNALLKTISTSSLSAEDKTLWNGLLEKAPEEIIIAINSFFTDYSDKLEEATGFLKQKISAIEKKDASAWNSILKETGAI